MKPRYDEVDTSRPHHYSEYVKSAVALGSKIYKLNCTEIRCSDCRDMAGNGVYNRCPTCGAPITKTICRCGTWIQACVDTRPTSRSPQTVARYVTPSKMFKETMGEDDAI